MVNHRAYVLDERLRMTPPGVPGELCIGGAGLARGYVGQPGMTASRFVPDPCSGIPGARLYRTGDLVRWTGDGLLEFLGRVDRQVKIRGFRVELGEVESALAADGRIRQVVVEPGDDGGDRHLVAYLVADPAQAIDLSTVRDIAARRLPDYMAPTRLVRLEELPLTPHGKIDRRALARLPLDAGRPPLSDHDSPVTATERVIVADILAPLLGLAGIGPDDDFFRLGGNSLQAMQVTSRVRDRFAVDVNLADFFVEPTARRLARLVDEAVERQDREDRDLYGVAGTGSPRSRPPDLDIDRPTALGFPQQRMWRMNELEPGHAAHHAPMALRLRGELDIDALRRAVNTIVARHAPLRARFTATRQVFAPHTEIPVDVLDVAEADLRRLVRKETERPFDLERGPMIRVRVYRLADNDNVLQWNVHHIVTDGWSVGVMLGELFRAYRALRAGVPPDLPPLPAHYRDFVEWQHGFVSGPGYAPELSWWREHLRGVRPHLGLPTDLPRGGPFRMGWRNIRLSEEESTAVGVLTRTHGVTLFMATLAAWALALAADADWDEMAVVVPLAGRQRSEWEPLIGYFVNRVVVRVPLHDGLTFADLMERLRHEVAATFAHQNVPFESLVRELALPHSAITVNFSIQNAPGSTEGLAGISRIQNVIDDTGRDFTPIMELYSPVGARFEASMMLRQRIDGVAGGLEYNAALFDPQRAERWARGFAAVLVAAARAPGIRLSELGEIARDVPALG
jgi:acyl carrier protein